ncbi:tandem-95 repeat protein [Carboxylicivirga sp. A043]|uniref:tandem-95 repeat protein n=1 Tax=Carboxylicivirga litoralis TaxID=2816963 RepID=UPI0021CB5649|nr:Ig-like domain-containing protein [Carboxylicivirga sp. A043]MCU4154678.1 tandem-95 repeat protein [Carboxylicivirga sp. A043]
MQTQNPINKLLKITCIAFFAIILPQITIGQEITISGTNGTEGSTAGQFTFKPATPFTSNGDITITFTTGSGFASETDDFTVSSKTIPYTTNDTEVSLDINIVDDSVVEGTETIEISVTTTGTATFTSSINPTIDILDNDVAGFSLSTSTLDIAENENKTFNVVLSKEPESDVIIDLIEDTNHSDIITLDKTSLTFIPGEWNVSQTVTVSIEDDNNLVDETTFITASVNSGSNSHFTSLSDKTITINVSDDDTAPVFTSSPGTSPIDINEDAFYSYDIVVSDADGDIPTITLVEPASSSWLSITPTGDGTATLSGTPLQADVTNGTPLTVILRATDDLTSTDQTFTLNIINVNDLPEITSTDEEAATQGTLYEYTITATDEDGDNIQFSLSNTPSWLALSDNTSTSTKLSGTPGNDEVGDNNVTLVVSDGNASFNHTFTITVANINDAPTFTSTAVTAVDEDIAYSYDIVVNDIDVGDNLTITAPTKPAWLTFSDGTDGTASLTGTPSNSEVGDHSVVLNANDGTVDVQQSFTITVSNINDAPTFVNAPTDTHTNEDAEYSQLLETNDIDNGDVVTLEATTIPGWLNLTDNGNTTYTLTGTPLQSDVGVHAISIKATDGDAETFLNYNITVVNVDDSPIITSSTFSTAENTAITIELSSFASDEDGNLDPSSLVITSGPSNGSTSINSTSGDITYTPNTSFSGSDNFNVQIQDTDSRYSNTGTITINVSSEAPSAVDDSYTINEDTPSVFDVLANDTDPQDNINAGSLTIVDAPQHGTVIFNSDNNNFEYTPNTNYNGSDSFTYSVCDVTSYCDQGSVSITITAVNDAPTYSSSPTTEVSQDATYTYNIAVSDIETATLSIGYSGTLPTWLSLTDNGDNTAVLTGTPTNDNIGSFLITLTASDGDLTTPQEFTINVTNVNDAPAFTSSATSETNEDEAYSFTITATDIDADDVLTFGSLETLPTWLTLVNNNDKTATLSGNPGNDEVGTYNITLTVNDGTITVEQAFTLTVLNVNDAPVFTSGAITTATQNITYEYSIVATDVDVNDNLSFTMPVGPTWLTLTDLGDKTANLSGTPGAADIGNHNVTIRVNDGTVDVDQSFVISVENVNDAPTFTSTPEETWNEDALYNYNITTNDADGDNVSISATVIPTWLSLTDNGDGTALLTGTPGQNEVGTAHNVSLTVTDTNNSSNEQNFSITVNNVNDAPVVSNKNYATQENVATTILFGDFATDEDGNIDVNSLSVTRAAEYGSTSIEAGTGNITYTPNTGFSGVDYFEIQVSDNDGANSNIGRIDITVSNEAPNAVNDDYTIDEDSPTDFSILDNDTDPQNNINNESLVILTAPQNGTAIINSDASIKYTPNSNYNGSDSFTYRICDDSDYCDEATVNISITSVNDAPIVNDNEYEINEDERTVFEVLNNDSDIDNEIDANTIQIVTNAANGVTTVSSGTITYTPNSNYNGSDSFEYSVADSDGARNQATVTITVNPVNDAPDVLDDSYSIDEDQESTFDILANDSDIENSIVESSIEIRTQPSNGQVTINANNVSYAPNADYNGNDSFRYSVADEDGLRSEASVQITINAVNDAPRLNNDTYSTNEDESIRMAVLENDEDIDNDIEVSSLNIASWPSNGSLSIDNGEIIYVPNDNFNGSEEIAYTVADESGSVSNTASVNITIIPVNDLPIANDDEATTPDNTSIKIDVVANDTDADNDLNLSSIVITKQPDHGEAIPEDGTGLVNYIPDLNYYGSDNFQYRICDSKGECATATVRLTVTTGNVKPNANPDYKVVDEDASTYFNPLENDNDPNHNLDFKSLTIVEGARFGTYQHTSGSTRIDYSPNANYFGNDTIVYSVSDLGNPPLTDQDTIFITVNPVNDAPVAVDYQFNVVEGTPAMVNLAELGSDIEMEALSISISPDSPTVPGIIKILNQTTLEFTANIGTLCSTFEIKYLLSDIQGGQAEATVYINVVPLDSDFDNIPDAIENSDGSSRDTDNDGLPDYMDDDSDDDGISDLIEGGIVNMCNDSPVDTDGDGTSDYLDEDSDNDGHTDKAETDADCDNDDTPNYIDSFDDCADRATIDIPETFTPNGDGINDYFIIKGATSDDLKDNELFVFNRWGGQVFHMVNYDNTWDGKSNSGTLGSEILSEGTYFYVFKAKNGTLIKGTVYIKR